MIYREVLAGNMALAMTTLENRKQEPLLKILPPLLKILPKILPPLLKILPKMIPMIVHTCPKQARWSSTELRRA